MFPENHFRCYLFVVALLLAAVATRAATIRVGTHEAVASIRAALLAAAPGDTILVMPGVYREGNLTITKPVILRGEQYPVIDGEGKYENITVTSAHVVIDGFRIIHSGVSSMHDLAGIGAENADYLQVRNNQLEDTFFAVHIANSNFVQITNNVMHADAKAEYQGGNGVHLWKCTEAQIRGNAVTGHRDGIYFEFVTASLVEDNTCQANLRYGLHFMFSHHDTYKGNTFRQNGAGVAVMYTNFVEMYDNVFEDNWGSAAYGLLLKDISDSFIEGNYFHRNTVGILMEGTNRGNFSKNTFSENGWAVKLQANCEGNSFTANDFLGNSFDIATNGTLVLNAFQRNYWDRYQGYDLAKDGTGDVPFRPVSMYAMVIDRMPEAVFLWRSFLVFLLDRTERVVPAVIPGDLKDDYPKMKAYDHYKKRQ